MSSYILTKAKQNGVREVAGLYSKGKSSFMAIAHDMITGRMACEMVFFTDAVMNRRGGSLYNFIRRHKLGSITQSTVRHNPNSSNRVRVWHFKPDMDAMREMWNKEKNDFHYSYRF